MARQYEARCRGKALPAYLAVVFGCAFPPGAGAAVEAGQRRAGAPRGGAFLDASRESRYYGRRAERSAAGSGDPSLFTPAPRAALRLGDLITPTDRPTAPPVLDPWQDHQPLDTWIGDRIVAPLLPEPTKTPPPTELSIRLASSCPLMQEWPEQVIVDAPDPCVEGHFDSKLSGNWTKPADGHAVDGSTEPIVLLRWEEVCDMMTFNMDFEPLVTWRVPHGDLFGTSQTLTTLVGTNMELRDCMSQPIYTVDEKVYDNAGDIWIQYFLHNESGHMIAESTKFHPFAHQFGVLDRYGTLVAHVIRQGEWVPGECDPDAGPKRWAISYMQNLPANSPFADPMQQWPIAQMVTMMSLRDVNRRPNGLASPPGCHEAKLVSNALSIFLILSFIVGAVFFFVKYLLLPMRAFMWSMQTRCCPPRMRVSGKHRQ